jgi:hypothetical protein
VTDAFRVIHKAAGEEIEVGSIGLQTGSRQRQFWHWGIDTVLSRQPFKTDGEARNRDDAMAQFKAVWEVFASEPDRLASFLEMKRNAVRKALPSRPAAAAPGTPRAPRSPTRSESAP